MLHIKRIISRLTHSLPPSLSDAACYLLMLSVTWQTKNSGSRNKKQDAGQVGGKKERTRELAKRLIGLEEEEENGEEESCLKDVRVGGLAGGLAGWGDLRVRCGCEEWAGADSRQQQGLTAR